MTDSFNPPADFSPPPVPPADFSPPPVPPADFSPPPVPPADFNLPSEPDFGPGSPGYVPPSGPPPADFIPPPFSDNPEDTSPGWTSPEDEALAALDGPPAGAYPPGYIEPFDPNPKAADSLGTPTGTQADQDQIAGWNRGEDGSLMPPANWAVDGEGGYVYSPPDSAGGIPHGGTPTGTQADQDQIAGWE